jgi:hypothetical protein
MSAMIDLSTKGLSKLRGIGPIILSLGFQPVTMSAYREWLMAGIYSISLFMLYYMITWNYRSSASAQSRSSCLIIYSGLNIKRQNETLLYYENKLAIYMPVADDKIWNRVSIMTQFSFWPLLWCHGWSGVILGQNRLFSNASKSHQ